MSVPDDTPDAGKLLFIPYGPPAASNHFPSLIIFQFISNMPAGLRLVSIIEWISLKDFVEEKISMAEENRLQILHLSDLHITEDREKEEKEKFDRSVVLEPLIERLVEDRKTGLRPEIVVVTGDIVKKGKSSEYILAKEFFDGLLKALDLPLERLFPVPGNHDVNRDKLPQSFMPSYKSMDKLNDELSNMNFRGLHLQGLDEYFTFVEKNYSHLKAGPGRLFPFVNQYETLCGKRVGLVGLNSAWMCRNSKKDHGRIAIGEFQIKKAMKKCNELKELDLTLHLFHHPVDFLWKDDTKICENYLDKGVSLFGHVHESAGEYVASFNGSCFRFQAGGAYLGSESSRAARYQYITVDWENDSIELNFRMFAKERRKWVIDGETGDDGKKVFENAGIKKNPVAENPDPAKTSIFNKTHAALEISAVHKTGELTKFPVNLEIPPSYAGWLKGECAYMNIEKLQAKGEAIRLSLPDIFIPLYAHEPVKGSGREEGGGAAPGAGRDSGHTGGKDDAHGTGTVFEDIRGMAGREKDVDIETLIGGNEYLLVEGQAGSGKTTLLRHLAYRLAGGERIDGLEEYLPVMIYLKDLGKILKEEEEGGRSEVTVKEILSAYIQKEEKVIDPDLLDSFCNAGKVLFLMDGLDEMTPENRDRVVKAFARFRHSRPGNKVVFSGRPHGLEGAAVNLFGKNRVKVLSLNMDQVSSFIRKWFREIYMDSSAMGDRTAESMIAEIRGHDAIEKLIDNPLMLTAICILYYDGRELPNQRAELYKKFVDNMIHRRFADSRRGVEPEKVREFLLTLAFDMHEKGVRGEGRDFALDVLGRVVKKMDAEGKKEYRVRIGELFDYIEPNCGLLRNENGEYNFRHLTFQEFLTAVYLVDNNKDYIQAIEKYRDNDRYQEVIKLYIGYLSIDNRKWANSIIQNIVGGRSCLAPVRRFFEKAMGRVEGKAYSRLILAVESLMDIHAERREHDVVEETKARLWEIIDRKGKPEQFVGAAETIGWLGDDRDLRAFVSIEGGDYEFEGEMVHVDPFEIGKYPVTNRWYGMFIADRGYEKPEYWSGEGRKWLEHTGVKKPGYWGDRKWRCPSSPVVGVSWYEADAFTRWMSLAGGDGYKYRLLTEIEWEAVAAGFTDKREYPWGDGWGKMLCNSGELGVQRTSPVGIFRGGDTPEGISDLGGNVWEWTRSDYYGRKALEDFEFDKRVQELLEKGAGDEFKEMRKDKKGRQPVLRGGSWGNGSGSCRSAYRYFGRPDFGDSSIGFRCART